MNLSKGLDYIDPDPMEHDKTLTLVSGYIAAMAFNEICNMLGGRFPDCRFQAEAPLAYEFFMKLFGEKR